MKSTNTNFLYILHKIQKKIWVPQDQSFLKIALGPNLPCAILVTFFNPLYSNLFKNEGLFIRKKYFYIPTREYFVE